MSTETGTAADSNALFALFRTFITTDLDLVAANQDWEELEYTEGDSDTAELYLRGKGLSDSDSIYVTLEKFLEGADSFNWGFSGATGFVQGLDMSLQPGATPEKVYIHLHNTALSYWFFANGRRFMIVVKVNGVIYQSCYCGFVDAFDLPTEYPYPLMINASSPTRTQRFSWIGSNDHSSMDRGGNATSDATANAFIIESSGGWERIRSYTSTGAVNNYMSATSTAESNKIAVWPFLEQQTTTSGPETFLPAPGNEYVLRRLIVLSNRSSNGDKVVHGSYDGVYQVSGSGNSAESIITINGETYIVFSNVFRTDIGDFFAVKQE